MSSANKKNTNRRKEPQGAKRRIARRKNENVESSIVAIPQNVWTQDLEIRATPRNVDGYRYIRIIPNVNEIVETIENRSLLRQHQRELKPLIVKGNYSSVNHYLDSHFRLLREDYMRPLREGVNAYISQCHDSLRGNTKTYTTGAGTKTLTQKGIDGIQIFEKVSVQQPFMSRQFGYLNRINFDISLFEGVDLATSKFLTHGSPVILSHDNFRTVWIGTIVRRNYINDNISKGEAVVNFGKDSDGIYHKQNCFECQNQQNWTSSEATCKPFVMIESTSLFQAYRPVLEALQSFDEKTFPFRRYFVFCNFDDIPPPEYINNSSRWDFSTLLAKQQQISNHLSCYVLRRITWPTANQLGLNTVQHRALQLALSSELAIIQGPPGTGKSFIASKIVQVILANSHFINGPILVVCYTNHALDAFLEKILKFVDPTDLIRVGGQCQSKILAPCLLSERLPPKTYDAAFLQKAKVIGMTTSGAARYHSKFDIIKPEVVIIEEAAEIVEAHMVASLSNCLRHLILIGDHHQLRPNPNVHELAINYNLEISLFERLINNGCRHICLEVQHRMRPEISQPLMPHFYDSLKDHDSVKRYENIRGVTSNIMFISHDKSQHKPEPDSTSHKNDHEAKFVVSLALYFLQQEYSPSKITILTPYSGQVMVINDIIEKLSKKDKFSTMAEVLVKTVDNYQGDENDIVILSLVRSYYGNKNWRRNRNPTIGFLARKNRVCVALSRARKGLFVIGNFELFSSKSSLWTDICRSLRQAKALKTELLIKCTRHNKISHVLQASDFMTKSPEGGCDAKCLAKVMCGHLCQRFCHPDDAEHLQYKCKHICWRPCNTAPSDMTPHLCNSRCVDCWSLTDSGTLTNKCKPCPVLVSRFLEHCGHQAVNIPCGKCQSEITCVEKCFDEIPCGHKCQKLCHAHEKSSSHTKKCNVSVMKKYDSCSHLIKLHCHEKHAPRCKEVCGRVCSSVPTGVAPHKCNEICSKCNTSTQRSSQKQSDHCNTPCKQIINRLLDRCGHMVSNVPCGKDQDSLECNENCHAKLQCGHQCKKLCHAAETPHSEKCQIQVTKARSLCGHKIEVSCYENPDSIECMEVCGKSCSTSPTWKVHVCKSSCSSCWKTKPTDTKINHKFCEELVDRVLKRCRHLVRDVPCGKPESSIKCKMRVKVRRYLCGHPLKVPCYKSKALPPCMEIVNRRLDSCGHIAVNVVCGQDKLRIKCRQPCDVKLPCGHLCNMICHSPKLPHTQKCSVIVNKILPVCGHTSIVPCDTDPNSVLCRKHCGMACKTAPAYEMPHNCMLHCSDCFESEYNSAEGTFNHVKSCKPCPQLVNRSLPCGHMARYVACGKPTASIKCPVPCTAQLSCGHQCDKICHMFSAHTSECVVSVTKLNQRCGHVTNVPCHQLFDDGACSAKVSKRWPICRHINENIPCTTNVNTTPCPRRTWMCKATAGCQRVRRGIKDLIILPIRM